jgi:peptidoglycan/LPS O-acetylase OafA/YrhL
LSATERNRLPILDAIRFVCACWVLFFHAGFLPFTAGVDKSTRAGLAVYAFSSNLFYGSAGVIAFFVISGFCVHYPYRERSETSWLSYFSRRYLRIGLPMAAAYLIARWVGVGAIEEGVMWTLRCELAYYTVYPLLVWGRRRSSWNTVLYASLALWVPLLAARMILHIGMPEDLYRCVAGLPCWILGAKLAESNVHKLRPVSEPEIWSWRLGLWAMASVVSFLHFHSPLKGDLTHTLFAFPVYFWLRREIQHYDYTGRVSGLLASAGLWSYSLYVMHVPGLELFEPAHFVNIGLILNWARRITMILALSYAFYLAVERPSHWLARGVSRRLRNTMRPAELAQANS